MFFLNYIFSWDIYYSFNWLFYHSIYIYRFFYDLFNSLFHNFFNRFNDNILNRIINEFFMNDFFFYSIFYWSFNDYFIRFLNYDFFDDRSFNDYFKWFFNDILLKYWIFLMDIDMTLIRLSGSLRDSYWLLWRLIFIRYVFSQNFHYNICIFTDISWLMDVYNLFLDLFFIKIGNGICKYLCSFITFSLNFLKTFLTRHL